MICPHCGKDSEAIYTKTHGQMTRKHAEEKHQNILSRLDSPERQGAYREPRNWELDERFDKALKECSELEAALGY